MPVILATQEAEIRRITVQSQPGKEFARPYLEKTQHKKRALGPFLMSAWESKAQPPVL
jgi:hypothetical protein